MSAPAAPVVGFREKFSSIGHTGLAFHNPLPVSAWRSLIDTIARRLLAKALQQPGVPVRCLDVGCGRAEFLIQLAEALCSRVAKLEPKSLTKFGVAFELIGVDSNPLSVSQAHQEIKSRLGSSPNVHCDPATSATSATSTTTTTTETKTGKASVHIAVLQRMFSVDDALTLTAIQPAETKSKSTTTTATTATATTTTATTAATSLASCASVSVSVRLPFDAVFCIGSSQCFGTSLVHVIDGIGKLTQPLPASTSTSTSTSTSPAKQTKTEAKQTDHPTESLPLCVIADICWKTPPSKECLDAFGYEQDDVLTYEGNQLLFKQKGVAVLASAATSDTDMEVYEATYARNIHEYCDSATGKADKDRDAMLERITRWQKIVEDVGKKYMAFAAFIGLLASKP